MATNLIDLGHTRAPSHDDLPGLFADLTQLVGEPFRFARVSYGDELTLHFGDLEQARSVKLKDKRYGAYILGVHGSSWVLKSSSQPVVITSGMVMNALPAGFGKPLSKEEFGTETFVGSESRVVEAIPFVVKPVEGFGLALRMSDGSTLLILPTVVVSEEPEDEELPELSDWELLSPRGLLSAGPNLEWSFTPTEKPSPKQ